MFCRQERRPKQQPRLPKRPRQRRQPKQQRPLLRKQQHHLLLRLLLLRLLLLLLSSLQPRLVSACLSLTCLSECLPRACVYNFRMRVYVYAYVYVCMHVCVYAHAKVVNAFTTFHEAGVHELRLSVRMRFTTVVIWPSATRI